mmetsp:Transcript_32003/g.83851  ORF Transcript_32003/g.83851 Transcript_32003/m.83851 type:complete len:119 (-) Transcript_32003:295-651(-)
MRLPPRWTVLSGSTARLLGTTSHSIQHGNPGSQSSIAPTEVLPQTVRWLASAVRRTTLPFVAEQTPATPSGFEGSNCSCDAASPAIIHTFIGEALPGTDAYICVMRGKGGGLALCIVS